MEFATKNAILMVHVTLTLVTVRVQLVPLNFALMVVNGLLLETEYAMMHAI